MMGHAAESLTFIYLGMTTYKYLTRDFSFWFLIIMLLIVISARLISVFGFSYFFKCVTKGKFDLRAN